MRLSAVLNCKGDRKCEYNRFKPGLPVGDLLWKFPSRAPQPTCLASGGDR